MFSSYTKNNATKQSRVLGLFMVMLYQYSLQFECAHAFQSWLVSQTPVYAMKLPTPFQLIGQIVSD